MNRSLPHSSRVLGGLGGVAIVLSVIVAAPTLGAAQSPWSASMTASLDPLPLGFCSAVHLTLFDPATKDAPRNPSGLRVQMADFDMAVAAPSKSAAVGEYHGANAWSVCACQAATIGTPVTFTATYPASNVATKDRVPGVAFTLTSTVTAAGPKGTHNPEGCPAPSSAALATAPPATPTTPAALGAAPTRGTPLTAVPKTPAVVPVNPLGFTAEQSGPGEVLLSWKPVTAASYYVLLGPGLPSGGAKVGGATSFTVNAVPVGSREWAVASYYEPGPVSTPAAEFPRVTLVVKEILAGWVDLHTHPMINLAFGGKLVHGGVDVGSLLPTDTACNRSVRATSMAHALSNDRPSHGGWNAFNFPCGDEFRKLLIQKFQEGNEAAVLGGAAGAPAFGSWPAWNDVTHQKMWYEWIRRARDGGLRVMVALATNNKTLADAVSGPGDYPTDDKSSADLQIAELKSFVGRHGDFMEIAYGAADVKRIVQANKIAVVLGVEIDNIGNFNKIPTATLPAAAVEVMIATEIQRLYATGVRYAFPVHVVDNLFGGAAVYKDDFNSANLRESGAFWTLECAETKDSIAHRYVEVNDFFRDVGAFVKLGLDPLRKSGPGPVCPAGRGHRNARGLSPFGSIAVREMMKRGMIIDIDHMSQRTADATLTLAESFGYPVVSGHTGRRGVFGANAENSRTGTQIARLSKLHGMFGLGSDGVGAQPWSATYQRVMLDMGYNATDTVRARYLNGAIALGTDLNGLVKGPKPGTISYGATLPMSQTGSRRWDYNRDGVAHYGMLPEFLQEVGTTGTAGGPAGSELVSKHLNRSANYFWEMWTQIEARKSTVR